MPPEIIDNRTITPKFLDLDLFVCSVWFGFLICVHLEAFRNEGVTNVAKGANVYHCILISLFCAYHEVMNINVVLRLANDFQAWTFMSQIHIIG